jgi:uncharacterized RDD family membrane protein YckC
VEGPILAAGAAISPVLLNELVNGVGDNPDQLSILQHALNRTWRRWQHEGRCEGPIALEHYEAIGTMARALDLHAEKAFGELVPPPLKPIYDKVLKAFTDGGADPGSIRRLVLSADLRQVVPEATEGEVRDLLKVGRLQLICERVFKALTDRGTDPRGIRRPVRFADLCQIVGASDAEVLEVLEIFRKPSRSFLMPDHAVKVGPEDVIDISHESLMRLWTQLNKWADDEVKAARDYRRLSDRAAEYNTGSVGLLQDPDLKSALDFEKRQQPTAAWATLYGGGFAETYSFLRISELKRDEMRADREVERLWQTKWQPAIFAVIAISFLVAIFWKSEKFIPNDAMRDLKTAMGSHRQKFWEQLRELNNQWDQVVVVLQHFGWAILLAVVFAAVCLGLLYYGKRIYQRFALPAVLKAIQNPPKEAPKAAQRTPAEVAVIAGGTYARWLRRVLAFVIDVIVELFLITVLMYAILPFIYGSGDFDLLSFYLVPIVIPCCYHAFLVGSRWQATVGMRSAAIYVAKVDGSRVSRWRALARQIAKLVLIPVFWLWPVAYALFRWLVPERPIVQRKQWLGDLVSKTVVLTRPKKPAADASSADLQIALPAAS